MFFVVVAEWLSLKSKRPWSRTSHRNSSRPSFGDGFWTSPCNTRQIFCYPFISSAFEQSPFVYNTPPWHPLTYFYVSHFYLFLLRLLLSYILIPIFTTHQISSPSSLSIPMLTQLMDTSSKPNEEKRKYANTGLNLLVTKHKLPPLDWSPKQVVTWGLVPMARIQSQMVREDERAYDWRAPLGIHTVFSLRRLATCLETLVVPGHHFGVLVQPGQLMERSVSSIDCGFTKTYLNRPFRHYRRGQQGQTKQIHST
jgi:hypothetical protein